MIKPILFMLLSLLVSIVHAEPQTGIQQSVPEIAAYYHTHTINHDPSGHQHNHDNHWYLWRQNNKIEILSANKRIGEVWQKRKQNQVALTHLYHTKAFAIRYSYSDLKALNNAPKWTVKSQLVSPDLLEQLQKTGTKTILGYSATTYSGIVNGYQLDIDWIPAIQTPARIRQHHQQNTIEVTLLEVYPFEKAPWQPINSTHYDDMDYADIGDNESHPMVQLHFNSMNLGAHHHRH